ncbi:Cell growth-regulated gene 1 protein [Candida viswanathii]|uniref:Cell growth-regulated gene 1 protein n=1 Tax=Candida viswanathii TaxID=5486 RepID=A0A367Y1P9_9ASCO|nr:Cell growth-regulated gene 1 protein [Candida viswanathii]
MPLTATKANIFPENYRGRLTEGVTYDPRTNALLWIDIIAGKVHRVDASDGSNHELLKWTTPGESVGAIGLTSNPDIVLVCAKHGLAYGDFNKKTIEYFFRYPYSETQHARLRSNDGIVDPWGNLWIGVMNDFPVGQTEGIQPEGALYRITPDLKFDKMVDHSLILNGLGFNKTGDAFFWTDSLTFKIWKFDYDRATNTLSNRRPFVDLKAAYPDFESPEPDGFVMTDDGHIYTCVFSTSSILHVDSEGKEVEKIKIDPAQRITCVTIGGADNDTFFITTGHLDLDNGDVVPDPNDLSGDLGGFLFKLTSGANLHGQQKSIWGGKV